MTSTFRELAQLIAVVAILGAVAIAGHLLRGETMVEIEHADPSGCPWKLGD